MQNAEYQVKAERGNYFRLAVTKAGFIRIKYGI